MMKKLSSLLIIIFLVFSIKSTACSYIDVTDNGPVTIDTPITFMVKNTYRTIAPSYEYRFSFEQFPQHDKVIVSTTNSCDYQVIITDSWDLTRYEYDILVDVWIRVEGKPSHSIGAIHSYFKLSHWLIGDISADQIIEKSEKSQRNSVSTADPVKLTAAIYDPSGFFALANITYKWVINGLSEDGRSNFMLRNFPEPDENSIATFVNAQMPNGMVKSGFFTLELYTKDPIRNLTVDGHTNVELFRDQSLQLTIKIDGGSPPFYYCWEIVDTTSLGAICKYTNDSFFQVIRYFSAKGKKTLIANVENDVSVLTKNITILIYEKENHTQWNFILIAVCLILVIFIVVAGIAIHMLIIPIILQVWKKYSF